MRAPSIERKHPDIFCCTFVILRSFSPELFVKGTNGSSINLKTSVSKSLRRSSKFLDFDFLIRPRRLGCVLGGDGGKGDSNSPALIIYRYLFLYSSHLSGGRALVSVALTASLISRSNVFMSAAHDCLSSSAA